MQNSTFKYQNYFSTLLWLSVSAIAYYLVHLKFLALDFHTRDYAFYTEFIIKWSKPASEQQYSMNPGGYNFLGILTNDGCNGFYQWVHFEPIRFVQAFIYKIFHSLQAVFIFNSLLVCSPVLAITKWLLKTNARLWEYFLWVLLFVAFPATLLVAGYDNRPSMFLGVGYFWLLYSLLATRKTWLQFLFFVLLFSIREEALILNSFILVYLFFQWRKKEIQFTVLLIFSITWIVYLIGLISYFNYWDYTYFQVTDNKYSGLGLIVLSAIMLLFLILFLVRKKYSLILFLPGVLLLFQMFSLFQTNNFPQEGFSVFNDSRWQIVNLILLSILLHSKTNRSSIPNVIMIVLIPIMITLGFFGKYAIVGRYRYWKAQKENTQPLFEIAKNIKSDESIMTDYKTHQAFLGFKNLYCIDRLPCSVDQSSARFYPENIDDVNEMMTKANWYITGSKPKHALDLPTEHEVVEKNSMFLMIKFTN